MLLACVIVEHTSHDVTLQKQEPLELRDRIITSGSIYWLMRGGGVGVRPHDARAQHEREHELMMSKQCDRHDLVDTRCQSSNHPVELSREILALSPLAGLRAPRSRTQAGAVAETGVATRDLRMTALHEVDAGAKHLVEPGQ